VTRREGTQNRSNFAAIRQTKCQIGSQKRDEEPKGEKGMTPTLRAKWEKKKGQFSLVER
jgi:hypothetical protein